MNADIEEIGKLSSILADTTRLHILQFVREKEKTSNQIVEHFGKSQSTISQHLKLLVEANLLQYRKDGTKKYYSVRVPEVFEVMNAIFHLLSQIKLQRIAKISRDAREDTLS